MATAAMMLLPLIGRSYLGDREYAIWALIATISTVGLLIDLGMPSLAVLLGAREYARTGQIAMMCALSAIASLAVGAIAAAVWPLYAHQTGLGSETHMRTNLLIVGAAGGCRSALVVLAAVALGRERFLTRGSILGFQAVAQLSVTWILLQAGFAVESLVLGSILSTVPLLVYFSVDFLRDNSARRAASLNRGSFSDEIEFAAVVRRFIYSRGAAAFLGLALTQMDRWAVGLVSTDTFLSNYDLAARFAIIPKTAVLTFGLGFVHEASRGRIGIDEVHALVKKLSLTAVVVLALFSGIASVAALSYVSLFHINDSNSFWILYALLLVSGTANALTAPSVLILTGRSLPQYELVYLVPAAATAAVGVAAAIIQHSQWLAAASIAASLCVWSIAFVVHSPRLIDRVIRRQANNASATRTASV